MCFVHKLFLWERPGRPGRPGSLSMHTQIVCGHFSCAHSIYGHTFAQTERTKKIWRRIITSVFLCTFSYSNRMNGSTEPQTYTVTSEKRRTKHREKLILIHTFGHSIVWFVAQFNDLLSIYIHLQFVLWFFFFCMGFGCTLPPRCTLLTRNWEC